MKERSRVDWAAVLTDLSVAGLSCRAVARTLDLPESTVRRWRRPIVQPGYESGEALIALWIDATGLARGQLPRHGVAVPAL
ncbi:helix-turn-helix domain-containing protein [Luteimonas changyuni]